MKHSPLTGLPHARTRVALFASFCLVAGMHCGPIASTAHAQETLAAPVGARVAYALDTGVRGNDRDEWVAVFETTITIPNAAWLRLHFARATLAPGSFLLVTSLRDGEVHRLDAAGLASWSNSTAYLNGDRLDVRLIAAPGSRQNRLVIAEIEAGVLTPRVQNADGPDDPETPRVPTTRGDSTQCGICVTDDRTPSSETWSGRIMPVGCSATVICEDSTIISAGHCVGANQIIQFNVPASTGSCGLVNPPVADQFPISVFSSVNAGVGNDWAVYTSGVNPLNQKPFQRYGQLKRLASAPAAAGAATEMFGYGIDLTCTRTQTQQRSPGTITSRLNAYYSFNNDVRGGNSGSGYLAGGNVIGVVTHCSICGGNIATRIDLPAFASAINAAMMCDGAFAVSFSAVGSSPSLSISPPALDGAAGGVPPYTRFYLPGTTVTASAPAPVSPAPVFHGWRLNDVDQGPARVLQFDVTSTTSAVAVYVPGPCPGDRDNGSGTGTPDGGIDINDLLYFLDRFEAGARAADLDDGSLTRTPDGAVDINDLLFFLYAFEGGC